MSNAASNLMWEERAKRALAFALAIGAALATSLLLLLAVATRPAEAAFPGVNGKIVFSSNRDGDYDIYVMKSDGTALTQLTNHGADDREPAFSADGSRIAFSRDGRIWLMNADGSGQAPLTSNQYSQGSDPTFSPDGDKIAFASRSDILVMDADGSGTPTNLTNDSPQDINPAWSPDGSKIAFSGYRSGELGLYIANADGSGTPTEVGGAPIEGSGPAFSPDGSRIAFHREISNDSDIFVMNSDGNNPSELFDLVPSTIKQISCGWLCITYTGTDTGYQANPAFSPDGKKLAFRRNDDIWVGQVTGRGPNLDGSWTPTRLTSTAAIDTEPDWGPLSHDLSLVQSDSPDPVKVNNNLTYTLKVTNDGYDTAPGVVLTDKLPAGVTFVSASSGCSHSGGKVTCKLGSVGGATPRNPAGTTVTRTITVKPTAQGTITNTASVKSIAQELTYTDNNSDRERTEVTLNRAPVANDDSYVTKEDTPLTISAPGVLADDSDADSDRLQVAEVVETTSGGTLTHQANGSFTYTPNTNFNGADAFTYKATDGITQSNVATVTIVVRAVNDAPNAADDSAQTETNTPLNINVLSNDRDPERDEISITNVSDPRYGTATLNSDGTIRYAPDTSYYLGIPGRYYMGSDPFTYTVSDGNGATDTATVYIRVDDTIAPETPVITSPANNTTDTDGSFTLSGTAEPYSQVEPKDGGLPINQDDMALGAIAGPDGTWSIELSNVSEGSHSYTVDSQDAAGNSAVSEAVTVIVDIP